MDGPRGYRSMSQVNPAVATAARPQNRWALPAGLALAFAYTFGLALWRGTASAETPARPRSGWPFWKHVIYCTYVKIGEDRLLALAAGVVFFGLLALFPAITALVSSYALFANPATISSHLAALSSMMPADAYKIIDEQVNRIVGHATGTLGFTFFFGLALALWSANAGMKAVIDALNMVDGVKERRGFIRLNLVSLAFTVGAIGGLLLAIGAIVVLPIVMSTLRLEGYGNTISTWLRWPALFLLLLFGVAVLYRFGPDRDNARWQWISPGAIFAAVAWLAGSALLSWYLSNFADYDATYGSLGAGIGLMMWLWVTAIVVLVGAEFNSVIDAADPDVPNPPQERAATR
jgi:membrane protein